MTRIDFYSNAESKLQLACQLAAKALRQRLNTVIYAPEETVARDIDRMLWTYEAIGFVPHCMASHALAAQTPVVIAREDGETPHHQVMVNLHAETPTVFARFERLVEIVGTNDADRQAARERFRFYRDRGYEIHHHDMAKAAA